MIWLFIGAEILAAILIFYVKSLMRYMYIGLLLEISEICIILYSLCIIHTQRHAPLI